MKRSTKLLLVTSISLACAAGFAANGTAHNSEPLTTKPPAFPGAVGFGATATGGRGGAVVHVRTLDDSGSGSLREALERKGPRTVVFDVGGTITLRSPLHASGDLTLAGQSAPGEGIELRGYEVSFSGEKNIIVRYIRFRQGLTPRQEKKYTVALGQTDSVIFDHCSIEWGRWDCIGMSKSNNITLQNCIIGEGIDPQRFGCLCESDNVTFFRNLWINNTSRNPKGKGHIQYINNVVYNWGVTGYVGGHSGADHWADLINNCFVKGPSSNDRFAGEFAATDHIYLSGNVADLNRDGALNPRPVAGGDLGTVTIAPAPWHPGLLPGTEGAEAAFRSVLAEAGASLHRDAVDERLIREAASLGKIGQITHDPATLPPAPPLPTQNAVERDSEYSRDNRAVDPATGYTALEQFLNGMTAHRE